MGFLETQGHSDSGRNFISDEDGIRMGPERDCAQTIPVIPNNPEKSTKSIHVGRLKRATRLVLVKVGYMVLKLSEFSSIYGWIPEC